MVKCTGWCKTGFIAIGVVGILFILDVGGIRSRIFGKGKKGKKFPLPYGPSPDQVREVVPGGVAPYAETTGHNIVSLWKPPFGYPGGDAADPNIGTLKSMMGYRPRRHQRITLSGH